MKTPFILALIALIVLISQPQQTNADCDNTDDFKSNSGQCKCRADEAGDLVKKNGNKGSSSDEDSDSGNGDSGSDSGSDDDGDGNSDSDSGNSGDLEDDWDSLPDEEQEAGNVTATGTPATGATKRYRRNRYHCDLIDAVRNISIEVCDEEQKGRLEKCLWKIEHFLSHSFGLSDEKRAAQAAHKLKQCLKKHWDIGKKMYFKKITTWGSVFDVTYVHMDLSAVFIDITITLDSSDDCILFESLRNATEGDSEKSSAVLVLIEELKMVLLDVSLTMSQKKAKCFDVFKAFFEIHIDWEEEFGDFEIEGFGSLGQFIDMVHGHKRALTLSVVISGSSDSDSPLLAGLTEASANTSFSISERSQIKQYHDKLLNFFSTNVEIEVRLAYITAQYWQMIIMEPWMVKRLAQISLHDKACGCEWGIFADILWVSQFCKNSGSCGCLSCGQNPPTTPATTTIPPKVCGNRKDMIFVFMPQNTTYLTDVLLYHYNNVFNASMRLGFNTCLNQVRSAIWDNVTYSTISLKINKTVTAFKSYNANNPDKQKVLYDMYIPQWNGQIRDWVGCGGA